MLGGEIVAGYGPFSVQGEYLGAGYDRDNLAILQANAAGNYAPGGSRLDFDGFCAYATWFLTGETRASAYQLSSLNPATFGPIDIKNKFSKGGVGAWELAARLSAINLDNGPYSGAQFGNPVPLKAGGGAGGAFVPGSSAAAAAPVQ